MHDIQLNGYSGSCDLGTVHQWGQNDRGLLIGACQTAGEWKDVSYKAIKVLLAKDNPGDARLRDETLAKAKGDALRLFDREG
ncbi:MAG: hypothetical protein ACE5LU_22585 [Anaerolineae bacterium]